MTRTSHVSRASLVGASRHECYDDASLIADLAAGRVTSTAAFTELYRRYAPALLGIVAARTGGDLSRAEDICAAAWARAWKAFPDYAYAGRPYIAFMTTLALNIWRDGLRSFWHLRVEHRDDPYALELSSPAVPATEEQVVAAWEESRDAAALAGIGPALTAVCTERQATALALQYFGDLPLATIAQTLGLSEPAAKSLLHRGRAALRKSDTIRRIYSEVHDMESSNG